jgi:hypothetical protein
MIKIVGCALAQNFQAARHQNPEAPYRPMPAGSE